MRADWAIALLIAYLVVAGGTSVAETHTLPRLVNGLIGIALIGTYLVSLPRSFDRIDVATLGALVLFLVACVMSQFPRQSVDSALIAFSYSAAFHLARRRLANQRDRRHLITTLCVLSFVVAIVVAAAWIGTAIEYRQITGRIPPLDLKYSTAPWGHRHDVALLLVLLAPAWFVAPRSRLRAGFAAMALLSTTVVVFLDGSRTVWLAIAVAATYVLVPEVWRRVKNRRPLTTHLGWVALAAALGLVLLATLSAAPAVFRRLADSGPVAARGELWGASIQVWADHPLFGIGPGSFPWSLQTTQYFDVNSWAPRHPDNTFFRLLAEGGTFGLAAGCILLAAVAWPILRRRKTPAAVFALIAFALSTVGSEPTEFGFLIAAALAWAAYALPSRVPTPVPVHDRRSALATARWTALSAILVAVIGFAVASAAHDSAARASAAGRIPDAVSALTMAISYDPGMALYWRERGILHLVQGDLERAETDLRRAHKLNGSDDVTVRALAVAAVLRDEFRDARMWVERALDIQRADVLNQLLAARVHVLAGDETTATLLFADIVQAFPWITAVPEWADNLPPGVTTDELISVAIANWQRGEQPPGPFDVQAVWLTVLADVPSLGEEAAALSGGPESIAPAIAAVMRCDADSALAAIGNAGPDALAQPIYWTLHAAVASLAGSSNEPGLRVFAMTTGYQFPEGSAQSVDVLHETRTLGLTLDHWGYDRLSIETPSSQMKVPNPEHGMERWFLDPSGAALTSGVEPLISQCLGHRSDTDDHARADSVLAYGPLRFSLSAYTGHPSTTPSSE